MISSFIKKYLDPNRSVLLGLSGGPDSTALLHLLLEQGIKFSIAHIDHGWRAESAVEAAVLQSLAEKLNIPFHLRKLNLETAIQGDKVMQDFESGSFAMGVDHSQKVKATPIANDYGSKDCVNLSPSIAVFRLNGVEGNLEAASRVERLKFFSQLCQENNYQAVILGHHADDQSETILKRVFEGASLTNLRSMDFVSHYENLVIWRPLLHISKKAILEWLQERRIKFFDDYTNRDQQFLRARMREGIVPQLSHAFGKEISGGLLQLGEEARELKLHLDELCIPILQKVEAGPMGLMLDLNDCSSHYLLKHLIRQLSQDLSREQLNLAADFLADKASNKQISEHLYVDRGRLFVLKSQPLLPETAVKLQDEIRFGPWKIKVSKDIVPNACGWVNAWKGLLQVTLPEGDYFLSSCKQNAALRKLWSNNKVPTVLRERVPILKSDSGVCCELLTGKTPVGNAFSVTLRLGSFQK